MISVNGGPSGWFLKNSVSLTIEKSEHQILAPLSNGALFQNPGGICALASRFLNLGFIK